MNLPSIRLFLAFNRGGLGEEVVQLCEKLEKSMSRKKHTQSEMFPLVQTNQGHE